MLLIDKQDHFFNDSWVNQFTPNLISIVIPVYSVKQTSLVKLIQYLSDTYQNLNLEFIIVNNGIESRFFDEQIILKKENIYIHHFDENRGASWGRNRGALLARGEYILFIDSDVIKLVDSCLQNMMEVLNENKDIGVIGGQIIALPNGTEILHMSNSADVSFKNRRESYKLIADTYCNTSCVMVRRAPFKTVGGFTDFIEYMHDDVDFGYKMNRAGYRCVVDYRCLCYHPENEVDGINERAVLMMYKNSIIFHFINYSWKELLSIVYKRLFNLVGEADSAAPRVDNEVVIVKSSVKMVYLRCFLKAIKILIPKLFKLYYYRLKRQKFLLQIIPVGK